MVVVGSYIPQPPNVFSGGSSSSRRIYWVRCYKRGGSLFWKVVEELTVDEAFRCVVVMTVAMAVKLCGYCERGEFRRCGRPPSSCNFDGRDFH